MRRVICCLLCCLICCLCACKNTETISCVEETVVNTQQSEIIPKERLDNISKTAYGTLIKCCKNPSEYSEIIASVGGNVSKEFLDNLENKSYTIKDTIKEGGTWTYTDIVTTVSNIPNDIVDENKFNQLTMGGKQKFVQDLFQCANAVAYATEKGHNKFYSQLNGANTETVGQLYEYLEAKEGMGSVLMASIMEAKPIIYLYGYEGKVDVTFVDKVKNSLICTYPDYKDGWTINAKPNGVLSDTQGRTYDYLFWEGLPNHNYSIEEGFCVKGTDTVEFLEDKLTILGFNDKEQEDFITYWMPKLSVNPWNVITFKTDEYIENTPIMVTPTPQNIIRVLMVWYPVTEKVDITEQNIEQKSVDRTQPTLIEWGGLPISSNIVE